MSKTEKYAYDYPRPALTVDAVVLTFSGNELRVLLIQRANEPYKGKWVFPGGFVDKHETVEKAVSRELLEETSLSLSDFLLFDVASVPGRDPRGWTVSAVFLGFVKWENAAIEAGDDAGKVAWTSVFKLPELAFDHADIFKRARRKLKDIVRLSVINPAVLPSVFLLEQLRALYFQITGSREETEILIQRLIDFLVIVPHTYRDLYTFNMDRYSQVIRYGFTRS